MMHAMREIGLAETPRGILLSLPPRFWLLVSLRRTIRSLQAGEAAWTYLAPAKDAVRIEQWIAEVELQLAADRRRRAWSATDAEWEAAPVRLEASTPPAPLPPIIVKLPSAATTKGTLKLLERLQASEVLVQTPDVGRAGAPRIFVLRPLGALVRTSLAQRAIADCLVQPSCDGLFGPETSQTWIFPTITPEEPRL